MTTIMYFFWTGFSGAAVVPPVNGPIVFHAGTIYRPGAQAAEIYRPGAPTGEIYRPGSMAGTAQ